MFPDSLSLSQLLTVNEADNGMRLNMDASERVCAHMWLCVAVCELALLSNEGVNKDDSYCWQERVFLNHIPAFPNSLSLP